MSIDLTIYTTRETPLTPADVAARLVAYGCKAEVMAESEDASTRWFVSPGDEDATSTAVDATLIVFDVNTEGAMVRLSAMPLMASYPPGDPGLPDAARERMKRATQSFFGSVMARGGENFRLMLLTAVASVDAGAGIVEDPMTGGGFYTRETIIDLVDRIMPEDTEMLRAAIKA